MSPGRNAPVDPERIRSEFPILERKVYLNSCSLGALSRRGEALLHAFLEDWHTLGAAAWYERWLGELHILRSGVERFLGAEAGSVALLPSTSAALASVTGCLPEPHGPAGSPVRNRIVCSELDFPTLAYQWLNRPGYEVVILPSPDGVGMDPEQYARAVDERTLLLATSHVFFTTGFVQDPGVLARIAHGAGACCLIDGYHGAGQLPLDLPGWRVDFYTTGPLKWLCGGPGLAYLYVRPGLLEELPPRVTGWFGARNAFDFDIRRFEPHPGARRLETGTPAVPTVHTALGGQDVLSTVGIHAIRERNRHLTEFLISRAKDAGFRLTVPTDPERRSAIVMVRHPDPAGAVAHLAERGIIVDHRPGHVRISPHFYNTEEEIDRLVEALASYPTDG